MLMRSWLWSINVIGMPNRGYDVMPMLYYARSLELRSRCNVVMSKADACVYGDAAIEPRRERGGEGDGYLRMPLDYHPLEWYSPSPCPKYWFQLAWSPLSSLPM